MTKRIDVISVARELGCGVKPFRDRHHDRSRHLASLVPRTKGEQPFEVLFNQAVPKHRQRFSIAHELGHTFFFDRSTTPARRLPGSHSEREEKFCDLFAGELLFPRCNVPDEPTVDDVEVLAHRFDVAQQVVGVQCMESGRFPWRALMWLWWAPGERDRDNWGLRVAWTVTPPGTYVPMNAKYRQGPGLDSYTDKRRVASSAELRLGSLRGPFVQIARPSGSGVLLGVSDEAG